MNPVADEKDCNWFSGASAYTGMAFQIIDGIKWYQDKGDSYGKYVFECRANGTDKLYRCVHKCECVPVGGCASQYNLLVCFVRVFLESVLVFQSTSFFVTT